MSRTVTPTQGSLFGPSDPAPGTVPSGLALRDEFITPAEEASLLARLEVLTFRPFEFHGWLGKRETVSFGWRYDFNHAAVHPAPPLPEFLLGVRARAAQWSGIRAEGLEQALVIRYGQGAGIGWHRDRPVFDKVVGVSLLSSCVLRFRRRTARGFERFALEARRRGAYLLDGEVRHDWEHSIAPLGEPRYSITFRSRPAAGP